MDRKSLQDTAPRLPIGVMSVDRRRGRDPKIIFNYLKINDNICYDFEPIGATGTPRS